MEQYIEQIETDGFCRIPQAVSRGQVTRALNLVQLWYDKTKDSISKNLPALAKGDPFVCYVLVEGLFRFKEVEQHEQWIQQLSCLLDNATVGERMREMHRALRRVSGGPSFLRPHHAIRVGGR